MDHELESLIESVAPQIDGAEMVINMEDWSELSFLGEREDTYNLHKLLTTRNLNHALKIQTLAISSGEQENESVVAIIDRLTNFFRVYKERYDRYFEEQKEFLEKAIANASPKGGNKKSERGKSSLSLPEKEVKFQSTITTDMTALSAINKKLLSLKNSDSISIPTYNDVPIPLVMQNSVEQNFPQVSQFLEKRTAEYETTKSPSLSDREGNGISKRSET